MATSPDDARPTSSDNRRKPVRTTQYMIAPAGAGISAQTLAEQLNRFGNILWTHDQRGVSGPPIAIVRMPDETAEALRRSTGGSLIIEPDSHLRAASFAGPTSSLIPTTTMTALGPDLTVTIRVLSEAGAPVEQAIVRLVGGQASAQGRTDRDGNVDLALRDEVPETVAAIFVSPRSGHWGLWQQQPYIEADAVNTLTLKPLPLPGRLDWGGEAMRFGQVPDHCRGADVKIALIDSGVTTSHKQLAHIKHGIDARSGEDRLWSKDVTGHGTPCAGIINAAAQADYGIRGYAPDSELHVCKLPPDARCSDLIAALDDCLQYGIDVACIGVGCERGSVLVERHIAMAKQQGVSIIAAAGNSGEGILFPACSPHVVAVGAVGQVGSFPEDSLQAAQAAAATAAAGGLFVPPFSCRGSELDLCAPGVAVIACQSPDGYAVCDGTSLAAAYVAALAALILADHADFKGSFAAKDGHRVERLFQILKDTAQPIGHPWQTGAGLPDAARALGVRSDQRPLAMPLNAGLREMRNAIRQLDRIPFSASQAMRFEPPRGPANVTRLPLNPAPLAFQATGAETATVHELRAAMALAGLAEGP